MAIAFDAASADTADLASGANHSHAGAAGARAAVVCIADNGSSTDRITGVTYAGVAMNRIRQDADTTEAGTTTLYWLDGITGGTQNVVVTHTGTIRIAVYTMTVTAGQIVALENSATGGSTSSSNPSWTLSTTAGVNTFAVEVIHSGLTTMTTTPASGWTAATTTNLDRGAQGWGSARGTSIFTGGNITCGWTAATADDWVGSSAAFREDPPPAGIVYEARRELDRWPRMTASPGLHSGRR